MSQSIGELALLVAAVMAGSFAAFPHVLLTWGVLYPNFTMKALEAYQRKHNLGVGGVTRETLQAMGIEQ